MSRETTAVLDGALAGTDAKRQARHKRRAERAEEHGPSRRVLWRQLSGGERLECGHVGRFIPLTKPHGRAVYRRCTACRDGLPVADREWFDACLRELTQTRLEEARKDAARELALADTEDRTPDEELPAAGYQRAALTPPPIAERTGRFVHWGIDMGKIVAWLRGHDRSLRFWGVTLGRWGLGVLRGPEKTQGAS